MNRERRPSKLLPRQAEPRKEEVSGSSNRGFGVMPNQRESLAPSSPASIQFYLSPLKVKLDRENKTTLRLRKGCFIYSKIFINNLFIDKASGYRTKKTNCRINLFSLLKFYQSGSGRRTKY